MHASNNYIDWDKKNSQKQSKACSSEHDRRKMYHPLLNCVITNSLEMGDIH